MLLGFLFHSSGDCALRLAVRNLALYAPHLTLTPEPGPLHILHCPIRSRTAVHASHSCLSEIMPPLYPPTYADP
jgi:hypothetical protein